jgi:hypothetical protein
VLSDGHGIAQSANTFDLNLDRVAVGHRLRFPGCADKDHVAELKGLLGDIDSSLVDESRRRSPLTQVRKRRVE